MRHHPSDLFASLQASPAHFRADSAMLVHPGVFLAFLRAKPARGGAGVQHPADHLFVRPGSAGGEPAGDIANIGAIEVEPDTLGQRLDHILGQTGIRAGSAGLGAGVALFDATNQQVVGLAPHLRMRADHFLNLHGKIS